MLRLSAPIHRHYRRGYGRVEQAERPLAYCLRGRQAPPHRACIAFCLHVFLHQETNEHLELLDGLIEDILEQKWHSFGKRKYSIPGPTSILGTYADPLQADPTVHPILLLLRLRLHLFLIPSLHATAVLLRYLWPLRPPPVAIPDHMCPTILAQKLFSTNMTTTTLATPPLLNLTDPDTEALALIDNSTIISFDSDNETARTVLQHWQRDLQCHMLRLKTNEDIVSASTAASRPI